MTIKSYMIVSNDNEENIISFVVGAKEASEFTGKSVNSIRKKMCTGKWSKKDKYKVMVDEEGTKEMLAKRREKWTNTPTR